MLEDWPEPKVTICETCKQEKLCYWGTDPYDSEIHNDNTLIWQCEDCDYNSAMEI